MAEDRLAGQDVSAHPLKERGRDFRGCVWAVAGAVGGGAACAALANWAGRSDGRTWALSGSGWPGRSCR